MFESVLTSLLNRTLGEYIENLNYKQLDIGIWKGRIVLKNAKLKKELISKFLKIKVTDATVKELDVFVPWKNLKNEPVIIRVRGVKILAKKRDISDLIYLCNFKDNKAVEIKSKNSEQETFFGRLITKIIDNLQIIVEDVQIEYEEDTANLIVISLSELRMVSTNEEWGEEYIHEKKDKIYKVLKIKGLQLNFIQNGDGNRIKSLLTPFDIECKTITCNSLEQTEPFMKVILEIVNLKINVSKEDYKRILLILEIYLRENLRVQNIKKHKNYEILIQDFDKEEKTEEHFINLWKTLFEFKKTNLNKNKLTVEKTLEMLKINNEPPKPKKGFFSFLSKEVTDEDKKILYDTIGYNEEEKAEINLKTFSINIKIKEFELKLKKKEVLFFKLKDLELDIESSLKVNLTIGSIILKSMTRKYSFIKSGLNSDLLILKYDPTSKIIRVRTGKICVKKIDSMMKLFKKFFSCTPLNHIKELVFLEDKSINKQGENNKKDYVVDIKLNDFKIQLPVPNSIFVKVGSLEITSLGFLKKENPINLKITSFQFSKIKNKKIAISNRMFISTEFRFYKEDIFVLEANLSLPYLKLDIPEFRLNLENKKKSKGESLFNLRYKIDFELSNANIKKDTFILKSSNVSLIADNNETYLSIKELILNESESTLIKMKNFNLIKNLKNETEISKSISLIQELFLFIDFEVEIFLINNWKKVVYLVKNFNFHKSTETESNTKILIRKAKISLNLNEETYILNINKFSTKGKINEVKLGLKESEVNLNSITFSKNHLKIQEAHIIENEQTLQTLIYIFVFLNEIEVLPLPKNEERLIFNFEIENGYLESTMVGLLQPIKLCIKNFILNFQEDNSLIIAVRNLETKNLEDDTCLLGMLEFNKTDNILKGYIKIEG